MECFMSKKIVFAAFLLVLAAVVFAADFGVSVGGGAILGGNFTSSKTDPAIITTIPYMITNELAYDTNSFVSGFFLFTDFTYAELSTAYFAEIGHVTGTATPNLGAPTAINEKYLSHVIIVDLLGKYPVALNEKFTLFPALGVGLKLPVGGNVNCDKRHDVIWGVVAKAGGGFDFALTDTLFLRAEALFAFQFASDQKAKIEQDVPGLGKRTFDYQFKDAGYNLGPQVKIAVGYKIF
jgi:hypothetical protein